MKEEDFQLAHDQYYLTIINDSEMYHKLQKLLRDERFEAFTEFLRTKLSEIQKKLSVRTLIVEEVVYVRLMLIKYMLTPFEVKTLFESTKALNGRHVEFCQEKKMMWLIDRLLQLPQPKPQPETQPSKENTMASIEIKTVTFINDADVTKLTDEQLIDSIKKLEGEFDALKSVRITSKKIEAKKEQIMDTINKVVAILDAR